MCAELALGLLALVPLTGCGAKAPAPPERRPDVVLITVDTLRRDHVGLYGYERETTPNIDAFFGGAFVYEAATSPSPCTLPAVKQLLSGALDFDPRRPRLAERLSRAGYRTGAVVSQRHFRDEAGPLDDYSRGFDSFDIQDHDQRSEHGLSLRIGETVTEKALDWLAGGEGAQPEFLWLHYFDPHDPYTAPPEQRIFPTPAPEVGGDRRTPMIAAMRERLAQVSEDERRAIATRPNNHAWFGDIFDADEVETLRSYYDAEIRYVDEQIGRVLEAVEARARPTVVVLTSDHGERLGEGDRWDHCQSLHGYEIDVPLLVAFPGEAGQRVATTTTTLDIVPTVLAAVGIEYSDVELDGVDLRRLDGERSLFTRWKSEGVLLDGRWKLRVPLSGGQAELYDLEADPSESRNLAPRRVKRTGRMMDELRTRLDESLEMQSAIDELLEELEAIGYVQ